MIPLSSVRVRIVAAFLAAAITMVSAIVFLLVQYERVARLQALVTEGYLPLAASVEQVRADQQRVDKDIDRLIRRERRPALGERTAAELYSERLRENLLEARIHSRQAAHMARRTEDVFVLNQAQQKLARVEELVKSYQLAVQAFVEVGPDDATDPSRVQDAGQRLDEEIDRLDTLITGQIDRLTDETERAQARANTIAVTLAGIALVASFLLLGAVLVALRPITQLTEHVQRLARGERPSPLDVRGGDEVALLAREFDRMVEALRVRDDRLLERAEQLDRLSRYLGSVLDSLDDGLFVVEDGVVTLANPASARAWGVAQNEPPPERVRPWVDAAGVHEHRQGALEYEIRVVPFGNNGAVVVTADVTDQRRALERAARSERLAWVGQMLAQITHEVRNPLNAMSLNAELLAEEVERLDPAHDTDAREILHTVSGEIDRLTEVTGHYLQLARRPKAHLQPEDLADVVAEVVRLVQLELAQAGVGLVVAAAALPLQLVDGNQLRQALLNVLRNAVEAGAHQLRLELGRSGDDVALSLTDDGPGMTADEVERAFDPFFSTKVTGTGLGLAITRQILEDHNGTIHVRSSPGGGTTVTLCLPWRPASTVP